MLANAYARIWRGSFVSKYAVAALLANATGALGILIPVARPYLFGISLTLNVYILFDGWLGNRKRWRERWVHFRFLAEQLRVLRVAFLIGITPTEHDMRAGAPESWPEWYQRRTARDLGLPGLRFDQATIAATTRALANGDLVEQLKYHRANAAFALRVDGRLGLFSRLAFSGTIVAGLLYLAGLFFGSYLAISLAGGLFAVLPAIGAALSAVRSQADFKRLATRSRWMADQLERLIEMLHGPKLDNDALMRAGERAATILGDESRDWKLLIDYKSAQK
jgi:hypothetical protein